MPARSHASASFARFFGFWTRNPPRSEAINSRRASSNTGP